MTDAKYKPVTKSELKALTDNPAVFLGDIDTSLITDMSGLFEDSEREDFSGISGWNTSGVTNMARMFLNARNFNEPIGRWDVSAVENMSGMFRGASRFNQPIGNWDTSNVEDMGFMFGDASRFNKPLKNWDTSSVVNYNFPIPFELYTKSLSNLDNMPLRRIVAF